MRCFSLIFILIAFPAYGLTLHYDNMSIEMGPQKITSPALVVEYNGARYYSGLYTTTAPAKTLHINYRGTEYWVGAGCMPGTYSTDGVSACRECGVGHYCTGGMHRALCTYGAIGCPGANFAFDGALPDGAPINQLMTMDQVNQFMPVTDSSQWKKLSCCYTPQYIEAKPNNPSSLNNVGYACATGTIGPGTYLFFTHYKSGSLSGYIDSINGNANSMSSAVIAVFDHPVSYASIHGTSIFQHFIDTEHPTYTEWDFSTAPVNGWNTVNTNVSNISNITEIKNSAAVDWANLCVYELK